MKSLVVTLLIMTQVLIISAQCPGSYNCEDAEVNCGANQLNGLSCTPAPFPNTAFPDPFLCNGSGNPSNLSWWAFIGSGGLVSITISFDLAQCSLGKGLQTGIYKGRCDGQGLFDCDASCSTSSIVLSGTTEPCEVYYLWVDGCEQDNCPFSISVTGNGSPYTLPNPPPNPTTNDVPCPGGVVQYCYDKIGNCMQYNGWTLDGVPIGQTRSRCAEVTIDPLRSQELCISIFAGKVATPPGCDQQVSCITIPPTPVPVHFGQLRLRCEKKEPLIWQGQTITSSCVSPPCSARIQLPNGCLVDSLVPIQISPPIPYIHGDTTRICFEDQPYEWHDIFLTSSCINPPCTVRLEDNSGCLIDSIRQFELLPQSVHPDIDTVLCPGDSILIGGEYYLTDTCGLFETTDSLGCVKEFQVKVRQPKFNLSTTIDTHSLEMCFTLIQDLSCGDSIPLEAINTTTVTYSTSTTNTVTDSCFSICLADSISIQMDIYPKNTACIITLDTFLYIDSSLVSHTASIHGPDHLCVGEIDTVVITGGLTGLMWDHGPMDSVVMIDSAGVYCATGYTPDDSCMVRLCHTIRSSVITLNDTLISNDHGSDDGSIEVDVNTNAPPLKYLWSNGDTTSSIDSLRAGPYTLLVTNKDGCQKIYVFEVPLITSYITSSSRKMSIYPNPVSTVFHIANIESSSIDLLRITNIKGQVVLSRSARFQNEIDVSHLDSGIYMISVIRNGKLEVARFLKHK